MESDYPWRQITHAKFVTIGGGATCGQIGKAVVSIKQFRLTEQRERHAIAPRERYEVGRADVRRGSPGCPLVRWALRASQVVVVERSGKRPEFPIGARLRTDERDQQSRPRARSISASGIDGRGERSVGSKLPSVGKEFANDLQGTARVMPGAAQAGAAARGILHASIGLGRV